MNEPPKHIGIIMDGNRRYAKRQGLAPWKGHDSGAKKLEELLGWCKELNIKELTLYTFSLENFKRPKLEHEVLMKLFKESFRRAKDDPRLADVRIRFIGRTHLFPKDVQEAMQTLMDKTKNNSKHTINLAMAYGGRAEIVDATRKIIQDVESGKLKVEDLNEENFKNYLYISDEPDLIIRTGGDRRLSNFMMYLSGYAELFFLDKLWPEFSKEDLQQIIREFTSRERRFGK